MILSGIRLRPKAHCRSNFGTTQCPQMKGAAPANSQPEFPLLEDIPRPLISTDSAGQRTKTRADSQQGLESDIV